jgi:hypothetical protein
VTPIDEQEPDEPELSQEEVEEIVGGLGGTLGTNLSGRTRLPGVIEYGAPLRSIYGAGLQDYGSTP